MVPTKDTVIDVLHGQSTQKGWFTQTQEGLLLVYQRMGRASRFSLLLRTDETSSL